MSSVIIAQYMPLVHSMAKQYVKKTYGVFTEDDLLEEGRVVVWRCVATWKEGNRTFGSYAKCAIQHCFSKLVKKAITSRKHLVSTETNDEGGATWDFDSDYPGQEWLLDRVRELRRFDRVITRLPAKHQAVLDDHLDGKSLACIGEALGVGKTRAHKIKADAITNLRKQYAEELLAS